MSEPFKVGLTCDFLTPDGKLPYGDIGLDALVQNPAIQHQFMEPHPLPLLFTPQHLHGYDAILSLAPKYNADTFKGTDQLLIISRFGVGYDMIDVPACTAADVALCIAKGGVDHSMAEGILAIMFALSYRVVIKDHLQRIGDWDTKLDYPGRELRDHQLGIIGLGGIGRQLARKVSGLAMKRVMAFDPFLTPQAAKEAGAELVSLEELLKNADFVCVCCPLSEQTRNLINRDRIALMKRDAYLINAARGPIVNEADLIEALQQKRIAGAGIDAFWREPTGKDHPLNAMQNTVLAPHCIGYTHEMFRDVGRAACTSILQASRGEVPQNVVNQEVLKRPGFLKKLERVRKRYRGS